jgi:hypothetical protein
MNTHDGATLAVFFAQPKFSEYMLLSLDSRLRSYIREIQKRKRPYNPEEIRQIWDGKDIDACKNKKNAKGQLKGQNKKTNAPKENFVNAEDYDQFPEIHQAFDMEVDKILGSNNTFLSQKNRRLSSAKSNSKEQSQVSTTSESNAKTKSVLEQQDQSSKFSESFDFSVYNLENEEDVPKNLSVNSDVVGQQNTQDDVYLNYDQNYNSSYYYNYDQNCNYQNLYQQSYVDENAQYNNQLYCGEDYYNSDQMHCNYYNECSYDYTTYDANTAYNNNFQNSYSYDYSNNQMYDYQNYSNHTNN